MSPLEFFKKAQEPVYNGKWDIKFILTVVFTAGAIATYALSIPSISNTLSQYGKDITALQTEMKNMPNAIIAEMVRQGLFRRPR